MWIIFLGSGMVFGAAALALIWIGSRVILSIRRQQKKFEIEDETYNKVKEAIKEKENKNMAKWVCTVCGYIYEGEHPLYQEWILPAQVKLVSSTTIKMEYRTQYSPRECILSHR